MDTDKYGYEYPLTDSLTRKKYHIIMVSNAARFLARNQKYLPVKKKNIDRRTKDESVY
jgi:hypothetical protein